MLVELAGLTVDMRGALERVDLHRRLRDVPESACVRGVFFNMLEDEMKRRRLEMVPALRRLLEKRRRSYELYPARELIAAYGVAGALVENDPHEGIRLIWTGMADYFSNTWYGSAFRRFLRPSPVSALAWIERSREHIANYGRLRLERRGPEHAIMHLFNEYFWIESAQRGGCQGMLTACGLEGEVVAELDDPYNGRLDIRWQLRN